MKRICNRQLKLSRDDKINDRRSQKLTATDIVSMSAMTHCQWAAGYHGNRTSEHSRPDHVVTFHGTFQLKPMCCPHSQSQCNSLCVCLSADQGRKVCVCVWKKCQFCVDYESSGLSLCKSRIYFRTVTYILLWFLSVYMCCVIHRLCLIMWCLHCSGSKSHCNHSSLLRCKTRSSLVKSNHKQIPKTGGAATQDSELIIETRVAYPSPTNKSSSIILHHTC